MWAVAHYVHLNMASEPTVVGLIQLGNDNIAIKTYAMGVTALWVYDYFLTLGDEVEYVWKTKNTLIFVLFLIARYLPLPFLIWMAISSWSKMYTTALCQRTAFVEVLYFVLITFFAHTVLTLRVYAITGKNKRIAGTLYGLTVLQFVVGVYLTVYSSLHYLPPAPIDLDAYHICIFYAPIPGSVVFTSLSLVFDLGAFAIVLIRTRDLRTWRRDSNAPTILDTVTRDTAMYFLVIFTSHLVLVLMLTILSKQILGCIQTAGNAIFVPMMITRIIISLKKAASAPPKFEVMEIRDRSPIV